MKSREETDGEAEQGGDRLRVRKTGREEDGRGDVKYVADGERERGGKRGVWLVLVSKQHTEEGGEEGRGRQG